MALHSSSLETLELVRPPKLKGRAKTAYSEAEVLGGVLKKPLQFAGHALYEVGVTFSELYSH